MRLLIDSTEISRIAETFRGVSTQLVGATRTVRNDTWSQHLNGRDLTIRASAEASAHAANSMESTATVLGGQATELMRLADVVRADSEDRAPITTIPVTRWVGGRCVLPKNLPLTPRPGVPVQRKPRFIDCIMEPLETAKDSLRTVPDWTLAGTQTGSGVATTDGDGGQPAPTVVERVQAALPPPPKKKKKGLFGRIFGGIGKFFKNIWSKIKSVVKGLWTKLKETLKGIWTALKNLDFKTILKWVVTIGATYFFPPLATALKVYQAGSSVVRIAKNGIRGLGDIIGLVGGVTGVLSGVGAVGGSLGAAATRLGNGITTTFTKITDGARSVLAKVTGAIGRVGTAVGGTISRVSTGALGAVGRFVGGAISTVSNAVTSAQTWVGERFDAIGGLIGRGASVLRSVVGGVAGAGGTTPTFGGFVRFLAHDAINRGERLLTTGWNGLRTATVDGIGSIGSTITGPLKLVQDAVNDPVGAAVKQAVRRATNNGAALAALTKRVEQLKAWEKQLAEAPEKLQAWKNYWVLREKYYDDVSKGIAAVPPAEPEFDLSPPRAAAPALTDPTPVMPVEPVEPADPTVPGDPAVPGDLAVPDDTATPVAPVPPDETPVDPLPGLDIPDSITVPRPAHVWGPFDIPTTTLPSWLRTVIDTTSPSNTSGVARLVSAA